jgi:hypothetical protein
MKKPLSDCALVYTCRRPAIAGLAASGSLRKQQQTAAEQTAGARSSTREILEEKGRIAGGIAAYGILLRSAGRVKSAAKKNSVPDRGTPHQLRGKRASSEARAEAIWT